MKAIHPPSVRKGLASAALAVGSGIAVWNAASFAFFILAGRLLGPEKYGVVAALLAIVVTAFIPLAAIQAGTARPFATENTAAAGIYRRSVWRGLAVTLVLAVIAAIGIGIAGRAIDGLATVPALLTLLAVVPMVPMFQCLGALQGQHRFWAFAALLSLAGILRPLVLVVLEPSVGGINACLLASVASASVPAILGLWITRDTLRTAPAVDHAEWGGFRRSLAGPALGLAGIAVLANVDIVAAKASLPSREAGYFGAVAVIAKAAATVVPQILGFAFLPRVASESSLGRPTGALAGMVALLTVLTGAVALVIAAAFATPLVRIFGGEYVPGAWLLLPFVAASIPLGLTYALVNHHIARSSQRFPVVVAGLAGVAVLALLAAHGSAKTILAIDAIVATCALVVHEVMYRRTGESVFQGIRLAVRNLPGQVRDAAGR